MCRAEICKACRVALGNERLTLVCTLVTACTLQEIRTPSKRQALLTPLLPPCLKRPGKTQLMRPAAACLVPALLDHIHRGAAQQPVVATLLEHARVACRERIRVHWVGQGNIRLSEGGEMAQDFFV